METKSILVVCTTDSMIWNFLVPHIKHLEELGHKVECACSKTGFYFNELVEKHGLVLYEIPFKRSPFKLSNFKCYRQLKRLIKEKDYDWIYCHEPVGGALGRLAGKKCKKKTVYIAHGFHFFKGAPLKHWLLYRTFEWFLAFHTDVLMTINQEDYNHSLKFHAKSKYLIPGIGVDFSKYEQSFEKQKIESFRKELGISKNDIVIACVGELSKRKNHKAVIEALKQLNNDKIHLLLCGEGELEDYLKKLTKRLNLFNNVHFLGFRRDVNFVLQCSDLFVFPSLWEGLGLAGLEAMHSRLIAIGSDRQGIRDYIIDGETGLLFDPTNYKQLADCIQRSIDMAQESKRIFIESGLNMIKKYSMNNSISSIDEILEREGLI